MLSSLTFLRWLSVVAFLLTSLNLDATGHSTLFAYNALNKVSRIDALGHIGNQPAGMMPRETKN